MIFGPLLTGCVLSRPNRKPFIVPNGPLCPMQKVSLYTTVFCSFSYCLASWSYFILILSLSLWNACSFSWNSLLFCQKSSSSASSFFDSASSSSSSFCKSSRSSSVLLNVSFAWFSASVSFNPNVSISIFKSKWTGVCKWSVPPQFLSLESSLRQGQSCSLTPFSRILYSSPFLGWRRLAAFLSFPTGYLCILDTLDGRYLIWLTWCQIACSPLLIVETCCYYELRQILKSKLVTPLAVRFVNWITWQMTLRDRPRYLWIGDWYVLEKSCGCF